MQLESYNVPGILNAGSIGSKTHPYFIYFPAACKGWEGLVQRTKFLAGGSENICKSWLS